MVIGGGLACVVIGGGLAWVVVGGGLAWVVVGGGAWVEWVIVIGAAGTAAGAWATACLSMCRRGLWAGLGVVGAAGAPDVVVGCAAGVDVGGVAARTLTVWVEVEDADPQALTSSASSTANADSRRVLICCLPAPRSVTCV